MAKKGVRVGIYIPKELLAQLDELATLLTGRPSRSGLIVEGIQRIIEECHSRPEVQEKLRQLPAVKRLRVVGPSMEGTQKNQAAGLEGREVRPPSDAQVDEPQGG